MRTEVLPQRNESWMTKVVVPTHRRPLCPDFVVHRIERQDHPHALLGCMKVDARRDIVRLDAGDDVGEVHVREAAMGHDLGVRDPQRLQPGFSFCICAAQSSRTAFLLRERLCDFNPISPLLSHSCFFGANLGPPTFDARTVSRSITVHKAHSPAECEPHSSGAGQSRSSVELPCAPTMPSASIRPTKLNCCSPCPERTSPRIQPHRARGLSVGYFCGPHPSHIRGYAARPEGFEFAEST